MSHNYLNKNRTQELINTIRGHLSDIATVLSNLASGDARDNTKAPINHNQPSSTITAMTGYSKPQATSAITASDTLNEAIGKLEKAVDDASGGSPLIKAYTSTTYTVLKITFKNSAFSCAFFVYGEDTGSSVAAKNMYYVCGNESIMRATRISSNQYSMVGVETGTISGKSVTFSFGYILGLYIPADVLSQISKVEMAVRTGATKWETIYSS